MPDTFSLDDAYGPAPPAASAPASSSFSIDDAYGPAAAPTPSAAPDSDSTASPSAMDIDAGADANTAGAIGYLRDKAFPPDDPLTAGYQAWKAQEDARVASGATPSMPPPGSAASAYMERLGSGLATPATGEFRVSMPEPMERPALPRTDLGGGPGPIIDNPSGGSPPAPEPPPTATPPGTIFRLDGPEGAVGEAYSPQVGQSAKIIYPDGTVAYATLTARDGVDETLAFDNSASNPESVRGKTITGPASRYLIMQADDRPAGVVNPPPPPAPSLQTIINDPRSVADIRADRDAQVAQASAPPGPPSTSGTSASPTIVQTAADLHAAVAEIEREPTTAQKEAGNYPKAHIVWNDLPITLESAQGQTRSSLPGHEPPWSVTLPAHYGYFRGTVGADTEDPAKPEQVDVYMGNAPQSPTAYVIDQINPHDGSFDEHKVMAGFPSQRQAVGAYSKAFSDGSGPARLGAITPMSIPDLKNWLASDSTDAPLAYKAPAAPPGPTALSPDAAQQAQAPAGNTPLPALPPETRVLAPLTRMVANRDGGSLDPARIADMLGIPEIEARRSLDWLVGRGEGVRRGNDGRYARTPQTGPLDLLQFIAANGGIREQGGELGAIGGQKFIPGYGMLVRQHGRKHDEITQMAWEAGYFGHPDPKVGPPALDALYTAMDHALRGNSVTSHEDTNDALDKAEAARTAAGNDQLESLKQFIQDFGTAQGFTLDEREITEAAHLYSAMVDKAPHEVADEQALDAIVQAVERSAIALEDEAKETATERGDDGWITDTGGPQRPRTEPPRKSEPPARVVGGDALEHAPHGNEPAGGERRGARAEGRQPVVSVGPERGTEPAAPSEERPAQHPGNVDGDQRVIPGAEKIPDRQLAERRMSGAKTTTVKQKPADSGLFDVAGRGQQDLLDVVRSNATAGGFNLGTDEVHAAATRVADGVQPLDAIIETVEENAQRLIKEAEQAEASAKPAAPQPKPAVPAPAAAAPQKPSEPAPGLAEDDPIFFSALERGIEAVAQPKADAAQWKGIIRNLTSKGVKQDEIAWSGINEWLDEQDGPITKEAVLEQVRANEVKIKEVTKTNRNEKDQADLAQEMFGKEYDYLSNAEKASLEHEGIARRAIFSQHTLPGGTNYRELLLTLAPRFSAQDLPRGWRVEPTPSGDSFRVMEAGSDVPLGYGDTADRAAEQALAENKVNPRAHVWFKSSHFDELNIVAHIRMDDRTDADGKKVLFVEEVQSDWHQRGRRQGYRDQAKKTAYENAVAESNELARRLTVAENDVVKFSNDPSKSRIDNMNARAALQRKADEARSVFQAASKLRAELERAGGYMGVPDAPFKSTWQELAMKRALRYAAEHGYDRLAWTTGEQQADRYDLSKSISRVSLHDNFSGGIGRPDMSGDFKRGTLSAYDHSGKEVIHQHLDDPEKLADYIGKDAAEKLLDAKPREGSSAGIGARIREISGLDLKVGGEGMRGFYDKILPAFMAKYTKKWGAKVGTTLLSPMDSNRLERVPEVHSVDITPAMRDSVMQGQALHEGTTADGTAGAPIALPYRDEIAEAKKALGVRRDNAALRRYLLERGEDTGFEHIVVFGDDGAIVGAGTTQQKSFAGFSPEVNRLIRSPDERVDIRHNHPTGLPLSYQDVVMLGYPGIARVVAYGHDGSVYAASLSPKVRQWLDDDYGADLEPRVNAWDAAMRTAYDPAYRSLAPSVASGAVDHSDAQFLLAHGFNSALMQVGFIDYRAEVGTVRPAHHPALRIPTRAAKAAIDAAIAKAPTHEESHGTEQLSHRAAEPLRAHIGDRSVPASDGETAAGQPGSADDHSGPAGNTGEAEGRGGPEGLAEDEPFELPARVEPVREGLTKTIAAGRKFLNEAVSSVQMMATPMATGSDAARTIATDWANEERLARFRLLQLDKEITEKFDADRRAVMGRALEEQSVHALRGDEAPADQGLNRLKPDEKEFVTDLDKLSGYLWAKAQEVGLVQPDSERIPYYFPRMAVLLLKDGGVGSIGGDGQGAARALGAIGSNLRTSTKNLRHREYETAEQTEEAIREQFGREAALVKDIRALPLALSRLERAIAGRDLINRIKGVGQMAGGKWVSDHIERTDDGREFFTVDHPAFRSWRPRLDEDPETKKLTAALDDKGEPIFEQHPIYVHPDFEGPLRAILTKPSGPLYRAFMQLKSRTVGMVMYSPLMHNMVEWGRAFGMAPTKFLFGVRLVHWRPEFSVPIIGPYIEGHRLRQDKEFMEMAVAHGLVPLASGRGHVMDITDIAAAPLLEPGRGLVAKTVKFLASPLGRKPSLAAAHAIDALGETWHGTLLWERVADLQASIFQMIYEDALYQEIPQPVAARIAAHIANRFAGAMTQESMSFWARKILNVMWFSRTFSAGNLGALKDATGHIPRSAFNATARAVGKPQFAREGISGLPRGIQAQIKRDLAVGGAGGGGKKPPDDDMFTDVPDKGPSPDQWRRINRVLRRFAGRKAFGSILADIFWGLVLMSLAQSAVDHFVRDKSGDEIIDGYIRRLHELVHFAREHPLFAMNPLTDINRLTPMSDNEKNPTKGIDKTERVRIGTQDDGTAVYATFPVGRMSLEYQDWMTSPLSTFRRKLSQVVRPGIQTLQNDAGFGRQVYDPDAPWYREAGSIALNFLEQQVPLDAAEDVDALFEGAKDKSTAALKTLLAATGVSVSHGYPGGPALGEMAAARDKQSQQIRAAYPDVAKMIQAGDADKAAEVLSGLGMTNAQVRETIRAIQSPESRLTNRKIDQFNQNATEEERARLEQKIEDR